ncbi:hypothetical protein KB553_09050 [Chryseobacterium rhizoplanae]|uniref:hypothetical protein n=1 Tax=Chryseobacterium rhizoplanae TaxID=1609531 RepID=UPI001CE2BD49|nr:hypothetical protein [Chryseobacterium rhizoplanae]UCA61668.1 hypothetical protein KB553_09050 [Chryseobacterium rhizoplanae]
MKSFFNSISILFCLAQLVSCGSRKPLPPETITDTLVVKQVIRDTVLKVQADSTYYNAWIECVNGKPVLKEPKPENKEKRARSPDHNKALQKPKVILNENGKLTVECHKEVEQVKAQLTAYYESRLKERVQPVTIEKPFAWYHKILMWAGGIFLFLIVFVITIKIKNSLHV